MKLLLNQIIKQNHFLLSVLLMVSILFPILLFCFKVSSFHLPSSSQWVWVLLRTLLQATGSSVFSIFFGTLGALGLCACFQWKYFRFLELFCLLPALLPPLVSVLSWLNVSELFFPFPFSFTSVLVVHVCINVGLVSVFLSRIMCLYTGGFSAWSIVHGIPKWTFLTKLLLYELRKDIILIFLVVFSFCFTSFSVPLLIGGESGITLEVFISETLKTPSLWSEAIVLFAIESLFLFFFFYLVYYYKKEERTMGVDLAQTKKLYLIPTPICLIFSCLPSCLLLIGFSLGIGASFFVGQELVMIFPTLKKTLLYTFQLGIGVGIGILFLLSWVSLCYRCSFLSRFLVSYQGASSAFMGFAFLIIGGDSAFEIWLKWTVGLSLLLLPALYRLMGEPLLRRLKNQMLLLDLMDIPSLIGFRKIIWPQCAGGFFFLAGVAAFWAVGDFAYSSIVSFDHQHLAMLIQDLFTYHRFELANILILILLLSGVLCFLLFAGVGLVLYKRSRMPTG